VDGECREGNLNTCICRLRLGYPFSSVLEFS
jgi:hypothetical protein